MFQRPTELLVHRPHILEATGSNLGLETVYPDCFTFFLESLRVNAGVVREIR